MPNETTHDYRYMPFGGGKRKCIGALGGRRGVCLVPVASSLKLGSTSSLPYPLPSLQATSLR